MMRSELTAEYLIIKGYYNDQRAKRSNVPLMNHIEEGLSILHTLDSSINAKKAFCLHPIVQNKVEYELGIDLRWSQAYSLACEYRDMANHYLCKPDTDWIQTLDDMYEHYRSKHPMSKDCCDMLIADKVQNRKDFKLYHLGTHERSKELEHYFDLWVKYLWDLRGKNGWDSK
jgi:hypothetical protein